MVSDRAFIFHICIPCGKTVSLVPKSWSFVSVKVKGHLSMSSSKLSHMFKKKMVVLGALVLSFDEELSILFDKSSKKKFFLLSAGLL